MPVKKRIWYVYYSFFLSLITTPLHLRLKSHPRMKYFEAKTQIKSSSLHEPEITEPATDDMLWPGESGEGEALVDKEFDLTARSTSFLNLDSSWLVDVLSEKPTAKDQNAEVQSSKDSENSPQILNNNFSLSF